MGEEHLFSDFSFFIALFVFFGPVWQIKLNRAANLESKFIANCNNMLLL